MYFSHFLYVLCRLIREAKSIIAAPIPIKIIESKKYAENSSIKPSINSVSPSQLTTVAKKEFLYITNVNLATTDFPFSFLQILLQTHAMHHFYKHRDNRLHTLRSQIQKEGFVCL